VRHDPHGVAESRRELAPGRRPRRGSRQHPPIGGDGELGAEPTWWSDRKRLRRARTGHELERDRGRQSRHQLVRDTITTNRSAAAATIFSPRVGHRATFDQPPRRIDLIGPVDGDVEPGERPRTGDHDCPPGGPAPRSPATWRRTRCRGDEWRRAGAGTPRSSPSPNRRAFRPRPSRRQPPAAARFSCSRSARSLSTPPPSRDTRQRVQGLTRLAPSPSSRPTLARGPIL